MTNQYNLHSYRWNNRRGGYIESTVIVEADTALEAVRAAARRDYPQTTLTSCTSRWGRHPDPSVRDNAHIQITADGTIGYAAHRIEAANEKVRIEALSSTDRLALYQSWSAPADRTALAIAGYREMD